MKKILGLTLLVLVTVLLTLAITAAAAPKAPSALPAPSVAALPAPAPVAALPDADDHPHIRAALEAMRNAKHELETAAHDFHGHRVESLKHLDAAIHEAEMCEREK